MLNDDAKAELTAYSIENKITLVDADKFSSQLKSDKERALYAFYQDEIKNLNAGGNLGIASDIIRWISPVYKLGSYSDFDVPVDTTDLGKTIDVEAPLLLNIGSLSISGKEVILSNNDYVAVVDEEAAFSKIEKVQDGLIKTLSRYETDFIEEAEKSLEDSFFSRLLLGSMQTRAESIYIKKSTSVEGPARSSRELRHHLNKAMTDHELFLKFNGVTQSATKKTVMARLRKELSDQLGWFKWIFFNKEYNEIRKILLAPDNMLEAYLIKKEDFKGDKKAFLVSKGVSKPITKDTVIAGLRAELAQQLGWVKWLFFRSEYNEINRILSIKDDTEFLTNLMKRERSLYLRSIVVCTTGPIKIAKCLFDDYVVGSTTFNEDVRPYSFNHYGLKKSFISTNSIPMHENILGMMKFMGTADGDLNDSSWLEEGAALQKKREEANVKQLAAFKSQLPKALSDMKKMIEEHIRTLVDHSKGWWGFFGLANKAKKIAALSKVLSCFKPNGEFDIAEFKIVLADIQKDKKEVFSGIFYSRTKNLVESLNSLCHKAVVYQIAKNKKIYTLTQPLQSSYETFGLGGSKRASKDNSTDINMGVNKTTGVKRKTRFFPPTPLVSALPVNSAAAKSTRNPNGR